MLEKSFICGNSYTGKPRPWLVRLIEQGERYGLNNCLVHNQAEPLVEFIDINRGIEKMQFVSRYYLSTLLERREYPSRGINLGGGGMVWSIDGPGLDTILAWLTGEETL